MRDEIRDFAMHDSQTGERLYSAAAVEHFESARATVLARLWGAAAREPLPRISGRRQVAGDLIITLNEGSELRAAAASAELFAHVQPSFAITAGQTTIREPTGLVALLCGDEDRSLDLATEVQNCVANLALARAAGAARASSSVGDAADAEQSVIDGHPYHPCCRARLGMSTAEVLAYAPEHRPVVELGLLEVPEARWAGTGIWPNELRTSGAFLMPIHPWQQGHVLPQYPDLLVSGHTIKSKPLMGMRTVAPLGRWSNFHMKTALSVQMTSAMRFVTWEHITNGPRLSVLCRELVENLGYGAQFGIQRDLVGGAALVDGKPSAELAVLLREAVDRPPRPGEITIPVGAIGMFPTLLKHDPISWLCEFTRLLLPPLLASLAAGVALEAHGQNVRIVLDRNRPVRAIYRDFGGVHVSPRKLRQFGISCPSLAGDVVNDDPQVLRNKLLATLMWGIFGHLVSDLSSAYRLDPSTLWQEVALAVKEVDKQLGGKARTAGLFEDTVPVKATTMMRLADNPTEDIWAILPNPLAEWL